MPSLMRSGLSRGSQGGKWARPTPASAAQVLTFTRPARRSHRYWTHVRPFSRRSLALHPESRRSSTALPGQPRGMPDKETLDRFGEAVEQKNEQAREASEREAPSAGEPQDALPA